jgi:hypothetical protein
MKTFACVLSAFVAGVLTTLAFAHPPVQDPVKLSPQFYKVLLDNDQVRVLEYRLPVNGKEPMHSHPPGIVYVFSPGRFKTATPDGKVQTSESQGGTVSWRDYTVHSAENIGTTEYHALAVELKKVCK